jgi:peptidoglycan hydrolase-like protein with peptidoglycan-binding domain
VLSPGHVAVAASETAAVTTATPLAQSLSAALTKPAVDLDDMMAVIRKDLAGSGVTLAASGSGGGATLVTTEATAPAAPPKPVAPKPVATLTSPLPPAAPAAEPAAPAISLPAEQQYSVLDRRRVQAALHLLGYYDNAVDGVFGPRTRAAIRHYQLDIGVPVTGTLTPDEATRLIAGLPKASR